MKKFYLSILCALFMGSTCMAGDVVTFEEFEVNSDGYQNDFGGEEGSYSSGGFTFPCSLNYYGDYTFWYGFAVSNRTETSFSDFNLDQYNSCVGHGVNGSEKYAVVYPQGDIIEAEAEGGEEVSGFYVTNSAWVVDAILNGDGYSEKFSAGDYLLLKVICTLADGTTMEKDVYLADFRSEDEAEHSYINDWQWVDLSEMGKIKEITFRMSSTHSNNWGMTTPGYFCMDDFNGVSPTDMANDVVTFEEFEVNSDGYQNDFGGEEGSYSSAGFTFPCSLNYYGDYTFWYGFAVSNRTETSFSDFNLDQYNSCVGHGVNGSEKYAVVYPQGDIIEVEAEDGKEVSGFYVTNSAWVVDAILNGDGYSEKFSAGDYLLLKVICTLADNTTMEKDVYLADFRSENEAEQSYINDWQWVDLSEMGKIKEITFRMSSTHSNNWGMTTPGYFCMDDFNGVAPVEKLMGDVNSDGEVDTMDITMLVEYILTNASEGIDLSVADTDGDNEITINDVNGIVSIILGK